MLRYAKAVSLSIPLQEQGDNGSETSNSHAYRSVAFFLFLSSNDVCLPRCVCLIPAIFWGILSLTLHE